MASAPDFREDVHGGHVEEGAGGKEHGDAGGVDVRQSLFAALKGRRKKRLSEETWQQFLSNKRNYILNNMLKNLGWVFVRLGHSETFSLLLQPQRVIFLCLPD